MNPESFSDSISTNSVAGTPIRKATRLESVAFYIFLIAIILSPLAFLPSSYIALDAVKTLLIALGTLVPAILYGVVIYKERSIVLPPRSITWTSVLVGLSLIVSSFTSVHLGKSLFGQGFELTTASFGLILLLAALVAFISLYRKTERIPVVYLGLAVPFIILAILHLARLLIGPSFMSLGILSGVTTTLVGTWYDLAVYAVVIGLISVSALMFLPLTRRIKIVYWVLLIVSLVGAFIINNTASWSIGALAFLALTIYSTVIRPRIAGFGGFFKRLAWLPLVFFIISGVLAIWGTSIASPAIDGLKASYSTVALPWQLTLDVDAGAIKDAPLFGVGPNHFGQAYIAYKPVLINSTYAWNAEFNYGFSLISTFIVTQGLVGTILWALFFIFLAILIVRALKRSSGDSQARFAVASSAAATFFFWVTTFVSVPSHTMLFYTYIVTAIAVAAAVKYGGAVPISLLAREGSSRKIIPLVSVLLVIVGIIWGLVYIKDSVALAYFGSGVKSLTVTGDADDADASFARAYSLNASDLYLQARAEAGIAKANKLVSSIRSDSQASTTQATVTQAYAEINNAVKHAQAAIAYDPTNYYNYASEARVSEAGAALRMDKAYDNAVNSYTLAIQRNRLNPALYLSLAQLQASQNKLDDALKTLGAALQVKNNYLDAIFLLSQVTAAQGNLRDAIIAAQVATQLNPQNAVLFFQLGILQYNNKDYAASAKALEKAVELQPDYANAQYFLGLSYTRLNDITKAIEQFSKLAQTNPDNQEISFILSNLQAGKSPFADAKPPVTSTPEKRATLPIKEKKK